MHKNLAIKLANTRNYIEKEHRLELCRGLFRHIVRKSIKHSAIAALSLIAITFVVFTAMAIVTILNVWSLSSYHGYGQLYTDTVSMLLRVSRTVSVGFVAAIGMYLVYETQISSKHWYLTFNRKKRAGILKFSVYTFAWSVSWLIFSIPLVQIFK